MSEISLAEFADQINEIMPDIARVFIRRQSDELFQGKITVPQFFILSFLKKQGELKMSEIARFLSVTTAGATGVVDRLVKYGYVARVSDPRDRRIIRIKLSHKGEEVVRKVLSERRQMIMETFSKLTQHEREDYLKIILKVQGILKAASVAKRHYA